MTSMLHKRFLIPVVFVVLIIFGICITNETIFRKIPASPTTMTSSEDISEDDVDHYIKMNSKVISPSTPRGQASRVSLNDIHELNFDEGINKETLCARLGDPLQEYWASDINGNSTINRSLKKYTGMVYMMSSNDSNAIVIVVDETKERKVIRVFEVNDLDQSSGSKKLLWPKD